MKQAQNKKICILVNQFAGDGKTAKKLPVILKSFEAANIANDVFYSERPGWFMDFIAHEDLGKYDGLVVVGGDGTIHEVVNGLMKSGQGLHLPLGIIPGGSGNAFADDLGVKNTTQAVHQIVSGNMHSMDVMRISQGDTVSWEVRMEQGIETLMEHAIEGYMGDGGIMPAKGGRFDLSDQEVENAVVYMLEQF